MHPFNNFRKTPSAPRRCLRGTPAEAGRPAKVSGGAGPIGETQKRRRDIHSTAEGRSDVKQHCRRICLAASRLVARDRLHSRQVWQHPGSERSPVGVRGGDCVCSDRVGFPVVAPWFHWKDRAREGPDDAPAARRPGTHLARPRRAATPSIPTMDQSCLPHHHQEGARAICAAPIKMRWTFRVEPPLFARRHD